MKVVHFAHDDEPGLTVVQIDTEAGETLRIWVNDGLVYEGDPEVDEGPGDFCCASCGHGQDRVQTFVVTTLDYRDVKNTRTEVCVDCWLNDEKAVV